MFFARLGGVRILLWSTLFGHSLCGICSADDLASLQPPFYRSEKLFIAGDGGYHSFRIPSIVSTKSDVLIAFCEGRLDSNHDFGDIDIVMKRSFDHGKKWNEIEKVIGIGTGVWGNPTSVYDAKTKTVFLFVSSNPEGYAQFGDQAKLVEDDGYEKIDEWGERRLWILKSTNEGKTWSEPIDMSESLMPKSHVWDAVGPGQGIQKGRMPNRGRLIVPAIGRNIFSDDNGRTWHMELLPSGSSESTVVEKKSGNLMRNDRATGSNKLFKRRVVSHQASGRHWSQFAPDMELLGPVSHASILRYTFDPSRILFINTASESVRRNLTLRMSYDEGASWTVERKLDLFDGNPERHGGYTSLIKTGDNRVGLLYEYNEDVSDKSGGRSIVFTKLNLGWLLERFGRQN